MWPNPQFTVDLVTFFEKILNGKLHVLCSDRSDTRFSKYIEIFIMLLNEFREIAALRFYWQVAEATRR